MALRSVISDVPTSQFLLVAPGPGDRQTVTALGTHCLSQRDEAAETSLASLPGFPLPEANKTRLSRQEEQCNSRSSNPWHASREQMEAIMSEIARWKENRMRQAISKEYLKHLRTSSMEVVTMKGL
jgi:hypothetical protein